MISFEHYSNLDSKILLLKQAKSRLLEIPQNIPPITDGLVFSMDDYKNHPLVIDCLKQTVFYSKELIDDILVRIHKKTGLTSKDFSKFTISLIQGQYDKIDLITIQFIKNSLKFFISLREIRNRLKRSYSNISVYTMNFKWFVRIDVDLNNLTSNVPNDILEMKNREIAFENRKYFITIDVLELINNQIEFWERIKSYNEIFILDEDNK